VIPDWWDILVVVLFSLAIFHWAIRSRLDEAGVNEQLARDAHQLDYEHAPS